LTNRLGWLTEAVLIGLCQRWPESHRSAPGECTLTNCRKSTGNARNVATQMLSRAADAHRSNTLPESGPHPAWRAHVNFACPYKLKQLIDLACQRNMLFTYDGTEYGPLLKTPRAFVVYARGGTYGEGSPTPTSRFDPQKGYIDFWLKFIGVKQVETLVVEGTTWPGKEKREESIARGLEKATKLGADF
jgi:Flavodoxin-like fold